MKHIPIFLFLVLPFYTFSQTQYQHWQWAKSFGGSGSDQTTDMKIKNGYLYVTGTFTSPQINWDGSILTNHGSEDFFIAKLDTLGNTVWVRSFGGEGKDSVKQMEINNSGVIVLLCKSNSRIIQINDGGIINPGDFYMSIDTAGITANPGKLPVGLLYTDVEIDHEGGIYLGASYEHPFFFDSQYIDTSFGKAGAVILKYTSSGTPSWYKNLQVCEIKRDLLANTDYWTNPTVYPPPVWEYSEPVTGHASARIQIEFDASDSALLAIGNCNYYGSFDGRYSDHYINSARDIHLKISTGGVTYTDRHYPYLPDFGITFSSTFSSGAKKFEATNAGFKYQSGSVSSLSEMSIRTLAVYKKDIIDKAKMWYWYDITNGEPGPVVNTASSITSDEDGNYLIGSTPVSISSFEEEKYADITVIDTGFNKIKQTHIDEVNRLPKLYPCMKDLSGIYLSASFADSGIIINKQLPGYEIPVSNNGSTDILIGKFNFNGYALPSAGNIQTSYKTCKAADTLQLYLTIDTTGMALPCSMRWTASPYFSDTTILNPKVYILQDTITNDLIITDALGTKYSKKFLFTRGKPSALHLVIDNTSPCMNDSITLRLAGNDFEPCSFNTDNWQGISFPYGNNHFNAPTDVLKYKAIASHSIKLVPQWQYYHLSPYCINSSVTTDVIVKPSYSFTQTANICAGSSYTFPDNVTVNNIRESFSHIIHHTAVNGCDSSYITSIVVNPAYNIIKNKSVCYGTGYRFPDETWFHSITTDTSYTVHLTSVSGCDSTVTFNIRPVLSGTVTRTVKICSGSDFTFPDNTVFRSVTRDSSYTSHIGTWCDSAITIHLAVATRYHAVKKETVCYGSHYTYPDGFTENNITAFTGHISYLFTVDGCDSIIETFITVKPVLHQTTDTIVCKGSSFVFADGSVINNISSDISHTSHLLTAFGCDSSITVNIMVKTIDTSITKNNLTLSAIASPASYQWLDCIAGNVITSATGQTYTASAVGSYAVEIRKDGCADTSSCYMITEADLQAGQRSTVNVYPVPSRDNYTLVVQSDRPASLDIMLLDFTGNKINQQTEALTFGKNSITHNISTLLPGTYTLVLIRKDTNTIITQRIIKL